MRHALFVLGLATALAGSAAALDAAAGGTITCIVPGEGVDDLQVRTADGRVRLLRRNGDRVREVTSETPWPAYNGDPRGNRYTTLTQIDKTTVSRLAPRWMFTLPNT